MGAFHILTDAIFVWSDIYQLKSIKLFSYSVFKLALLAPVWLDSEMLKLTIKHLKKLKIEQKVMSHFTRKMRN